MKKFLAADDSKTHETIDGIQVLRAVAAIMVVIEHSRYAVPGGEAAFSHFFASGVDIFFIISGFVMALTTSAPYLSRRGVLKLFCFSESASPE